MSFSTDDRYSTFLYGFLFIATIVIMFFALSGTQNAFGLPVLLIFGVIDIFVVLAIIGKVFSKTGLACKEEALGLPSGSIRALIALSLIVIFAIITIFMYSELSPSTTLLQVPANQSIVFQNGTIIENPGGMSIWTSETSQAQRDFSSQTLTTVSTLVVALAGFYFGTKAVETAKGKTEKQEPQLSISPNGKIKQKDKKPLHIIVNTNPENEKAKATLKGDAKGKIEQSEGNKSIFTYTPSNDAKVVIIDFFWESNEKVTESLTIEFA